MPSVAYIGIGSNLEQPLTQVENAIKALEQEPSIKLEECSSFYLTGPVGYPDQPEFINAVCRVATDLSPTALLSTLHSLESAAGRTRQGDRWGPRVLDLDLLLYDHLCIEQEELVLPHPRMHERAFVLYPLHEIAPGLEIPGRGPVGELVEHCRDQACARLERGQP